MIAWLKAVPWLLSVAALAICAFLFVQLRHADQRLGALETSNQQLSDTIQAKTHATQSRATTDAKVRSLAPADILSKLR